MAQSLADIVTRFDPHYRLAERRQLVYEQIEQAKVALQQQRLQVEHDKMAQYERLAQEANQRAIDCEVISGENQRRLSAQEFYQSELGKDTDLIHSMFEKTLANANDWSNNIANIRKSLLEIEADTIRQKALQEQKHRQDIERIQLENQNTISLNQQAHTQRIKEMVLQYNLKMFENYSNNLIQNSRVTYDGLNNIVMRVIERILGLGEYQVTDSDIERYVAEAMAQMGE